MAGAETARRLGHHAGIGLDRRRLLVAIGDAEATAHVEPLQRMPLGGEAAIERGQPLEGGAVGGEVGQLRADVDGQAHQLDARQVAAARGPERNITGRANGSA